MAIDYNNTPQLAITIGRGVIKLSNKNDRLSTSRRNLKIKQNLLPNFITRYMDDNCQGKFVN